MKNSEEKSKCIVVVNAILLLSCTMELLNHLGQLHAPVTAFKDISLVIIQVQAALVGLSLSIIALLSGRITDSYFGVKINDFIMNLRPKVLKQRSIIGIELALVIVSLIFHMISWYYMVFASFLIASSLIWFSVRSLYESFSGADKIEEEISLYLKEQIIGPDGMEKQELLKGFTREWAGLIVTQSKGEFNTYCDFYKHFFSELIKTDAVRTALLNSCVGLARSLLEEARSCKRGIEFINLCNEWALSWFNSGTQENQTVPFNLYDEVQSEFLKALSYMPIKDIEECFHWGVFCDELLELSLIAYSPERSSPQLRAAEYLASYLGSIISEKTGRDNSLWGKPLTAYYYKNKCRDEINSELARAHYQQRFLFARAQILRDRDSLVPEYILSKTVYAYSSINSEEIFMRLKLHCYLYYIAYYEKEDCAAPELIERCKSMLGDTRARCVFSEMLFTASAYDKSIHPFETKIDVFNAELYSRLLTELDAFELFPDVGAKTCVITYAIRDFVFFTLAYVVMHYGAQDKLQELLPANEVTGLYYAYEDQKKTVNALKKYTGILAQEDAVEKAEDLYNVLFDQIRKKYKKLILSMPVPTEDTDRLKELLCNNVRTYLDKQFEPILCNSGVGEAQEFPLLRVYCDTIEDAVRVFEENKEVVFRVFIEDIYAYLKENNRVADLKRTTFERDEELLNFLSEHKSQFLLGSVFAVKPRQYNYNEEFHSILDCYEKCTIGSGKRALFLDKDSLQILVGEIVVTSRSQTIEDVKPEYNDESKTYIYSPKGLAIEFEESELVNYLGTHKKIVEIKAVVLISYKSDALALAMNR